MTDVRKLRELAIGSMADLPPSPVIRREDLVLAKARIDFCAACHPQAIIEILDRLERYEKALEYYGFTLVPDSLNSGKTTITTDTGRVAREALEGGK